MRAAIGAFLPSGTQNIMEFVVFLSANGKIYSGPGAAVRAGLGISAQITGIAGEDMLGFVGHPAFFWPGIRIAIVAVPVHPGNHIMILGITRNLGISMSVEHINIVMVACRKSSAATAQKQACAKKESREFAKPFHVSFSL